MLFNAYEHPPWLKATLATTMLTLSAGQALAGGFAIREQSTEFQGMAFAGNAAGWGLSAMFWNPAATANRVGGINAETHFAFILPNSDVTVTDVSPSAIPTEAFAAAGPFAGLVGAGVNGSIDAAFASASPFSGEIGNNAVVASSYYNYQLTPDTVIGLAINSPFGLVTEPEATYQGAVLARTTKFFTVNVNPTIAYRIAPGVSIGAGVQIEYGKGTLKFATGTPDTPSTWFEGDDWAFGGTAGIMLQPAPQTKIGLGWRSQITHTLEGDYSTPGLTVATGLPSPLPSAVQLAGPAFVQAEADVNLPDIVTLSVSQGLAPNMRIHGTVEWSNWSRFEELRLVNVATGATIEDIQANWNDGWFFSGGLEYDYSPDITLRTGVAYEISPVDAPEKRLPGIPDADRVWLSLGGTYKWSEATSFDVAYTHVFLEDSTFTQPASIGVQLSGNVESSVDIISGSWKTRW